MAHSDRRRFLKSVLGALAQGAGTIVLASASTTNAQAQAVADRKTDIQERADELAEGELAGEVAGDPGVNDEALLVSFLNRAFRNGLGRGFRNGGFRNGGLGGGFRNGGFVNGLGGGFRNGAFRNW